MSSEIHSVIPQERVEKIKNLSEIHQKYITDLYGKALKIADDNSAKTILQSLDKDIETLESNEDPQRLAFNEKRENGFSELSVKLQKFLEEDPSGKSLEKWLAGSINNIFKLKDARTLFPSDFSSVRIVFAKSASVTAITRNEVARPILVFDDNKQFHNFMNRFSVGESTNGMFIPITGRGGMPEHIFPEYESLANAGMLVSKKDKEDTMGHEIRHSIDPLVANRTGFNAILNELFAYATQTHLNRDILIKMLNHVAYVTENTAEEIKDDNLQLEKGYAVKRYFNIQDKTAEVHKLFVETAVDTFISDCSTMGAIKALRRLGKIHDLESYFSQSVKFKLSNMTNK